jgi:hypothetical protein
MTAFVRDVELAVGVEVGHLPTDPHHWPGNECE